MKKKVGYLLCAMLCMAVFNFATCKYGFKDVGQIPPEVKTFRVQYFENRAQYINTQLSPQLTQKLQQKIINTTRLRQTNEEDAHYDISGYISQYSVSTISISGSVASSNRLTAGVHLNFKNTLDATKNFEADLTRNFDFDAGKSLTEAEATLTSKIVENLVDEIFNKIFSNW